MGHGTHLPFGDGFIDQSVHKWDISHTQSQSFSIDLFFALERIFRFYIAALELMRAA